MKHVPKVILRGGATQSITLTIVANEANMQRLAALLMFGERPGDVQAKELGPLPWEDENDPKYIAPKKSREQLEEEATQAITKVCNTWVHGLDDVKLLLSQFGAARMRDLSDEQLPSFIEALNYVPEGSKHAPESNNPDDLV